MKDPSRFVDASIFVNWLKTDPKKALRTETALLSGYVLHKVESGESAVTSVSVKDEVCIWISRYRSASLQTFMNLLLGYTSLEIVTPSIDDQIEAGRSFGKYKRGFVDLVTLSLMRRHGLKEIYSSDTGFDSVPEIRRVFNELSSEKEFRQFVDSLAGSLGN